MPSTNFNEKPYNDLDSHLGKIINAVKSLARSESDNLDARFLQGVTRELRKLHRENTDKIAAEFQQYLLCYACEENPKKEETSKLAKKLIADDSFLTGENLAVWIDPINGNTVLNALLKIGDVENSRQLLNRVAYLSWGKNTPAFKEYISTIDQSLLKTLLNSQLENLADVIDLILSTMKEAEDGLNTKEFKKFIFDLILLSIKTGDVKVVNLMLEKAKTALGEDFGDIFLYRDRAGYTSLHLATELGSFDIAKRLLELGKIACGENFKKYISMRNTDNYSALEIADDNQDLLIGGLLQFHGAKRNEKSSSDHARPKSSSSSSAPTEKDSTKSLKRDRSDASNYGEQPFFKPSKKKQWEEKKLKNGQVVITSSKHSSSRSNGRSY
jgi:ankyrin repeat protein